MEQQVEKFDPSTLMQGVKDRIKATFVSLIPDGQWETMVQKEVDAFFEMRTQTISQKTSRTSSYGGTSTETFVSAEEKSSPFRNLVWEHCAQLTIQVLKEQVTKDYFTNQWNAGEMDFTEGMRKIIVEAAPLAAAKFFEKIAFNMSQDLRNAIQQIR